MNIAEIRQLSADELQGKLEELRKQLFEMNFHRSMQTLQKPHVVRQTKKDIARILTVIKERERNAG